MKDFVGSSQEGTPAKGRALQVIRDKKSPARDLNY
jgi:hypothetical protein